MLTGNLSRSARSAAHGSRELELAFDGTDYRAMTAAVGTHRAHDSEIGDGRAAIVMASPADFGLGRIFEGVSDDSIQARLRIFTDPAGARSWLAEPAAS